MAKLDIKRKIGPLSLWVWAVVLVGLVVAYWLYRKHASAGGSTDGGSATVLTTGVLPQGAASGGYPAANAAPAQSLSSDVQAELASQFGDINSALSGLSAQQAQLSTDFDTQATATAQRESDLNAAVGTLGASTADTFAQLFSTFSPPAVTTPTSTPRPVDVTIHVQQQKAAKPKPTVAKPKQKAKQVVKKPGAKTPKKKVTKH